MFAYGYFTEDESLSVNSTSLTKHITPLPLTSVMHENSPKILQPTTKGFTAKENKNPEQMTTLKSSPTIGFQFVNTSIQRKTEIKLAVHNSVLFDCEIEGATTITVGWFKDEKPIETVSYRLLPRSQIDHGRLELKQLLPADSGDYKCNATNGSVTLTRNFILSVKEREETVKPRIMSLEPGNITAQTGARVLIKCLTQTEFDYAIPFVQWEKQRTFNLRRNSKSNPGSAKKPTYNATELVKKFAASKYSVTENQDTLTVTEVVKIERTFNSKLVLQKVNLDDDAEYSCIVFNQIGFSKASQILQVYPAPKPSRLQLALIYAAKYGLESRSSNRLPLSVTIALPVGLAVIFIIGITWWKKKKGPQEKAPVTLREIKKMRQIDNFSSLEHMASCSYHVESKRYSSVLDDHEGHTDIDDVIERHSDNDQERLLGNGNHFIQIVNPKPKPKDDVTHAEVIPMHVITPPLSAETPETTRSNTVGSHEELEWEPVDLTINTSTSTHGSNESDKLLS
eukprot:gene2481-2856_t